MANNKYFTVKQSEPLVDPDKLSRRDSDIWTSQGPSAFSVLGLGQAPTLSPKPVVNSGLGEKYVRSANHNSSIAFRNQREGTLSSGYGGQGITSPTVDITVGHMGPYARETDDDGNQIYANPNKEIDNASFYVSALDNPDKVLKLPDGSIGKSEGMSSIAGTAEAIRFRSKGEGGIKFVTLASNRNSRGQKNLQNAEINFITDSEKEPQPLVLGENLAELLRQEFSEELDSIRETLSGFVKDQGDLNDKVMNHNHNSPFYAQTTSPSFNLLFEGLKAMFKRVAETELNAINTIINKETSNYNYLNPMAEKYILSGLVKTT
jgi:hypothetical protein